VRILFTTPLYLPDVGGLELLTAGLARHLRDDGHTVGVVTSHAAPGITRDEHDGIPVLRLDTLRVTVEHDAGGMLRAERAVAEFARELDPDVVHAHDTAAALWLYLRRAPAAIPLLVTLHNVMSRHVGGRFVVGAQVLRRADWITGVSQDVIDDIIRTDPSVAPRISLVPNGIDPPATAVTPVGDGPPRFAAVGRLVEQKRFDRAVAALAELRPRLPDARLTIAGDGPERAALLDAIATFGVGHAVELVGRVPHDDVAALLRDSLALVVPSRFEGLPLVALEAAWMARPVVASDVPGLARAVRHDETGLLVPEDDVHAYAAAMERLAVDRDFARTLGAAARALAEREWSITACVRAYESLYCKLAAA
jgi:glycosyltransferase involved in cell wall biosynthesis